MKRILALVMLFIPVSNYCPIIETDKIADIKNHIQNPARTLVLFDIDKVIGDYTDETNIDSFRLVETECPQLIQNLQNKDIKMCALTGRNGLTSQVTDAQLAHNNINFTVSTPFSDYTSKDFQSGHSNGVIYVNNDNKGKALGYLLYRMKAQYLPEHVICIDGQIINLHEIDEILKMTDIFGKDINFTGLHYVRLNRLSQTQRNN